MGIKRSGRQQPRRGSRLDEPTAYHAAGVLYLASEARFDHLLTLPEAADIGASVNGAMRAIEQHNPQLAGVLPKTYNLLTSALLVIFDILTRPALELTIAERAEVKKGGPRAVGATQRVLALNWRQKVTARAALRQVIEEMLDRGLPLAYAPEVYQQKCSAVFEHVYESYPEWNAGGMLGRPEGAKIAR